MTSSAIVAMAGAASADQVFNDDVIITGSLCVGFDCVNGESFGFDTIRLKENNLRIKFQDTSNSASFPSRDWQITVNDSSNGGANKFSIDDIDGGRTPFTIEAGAPTNSLYVDDGGRMGLGTSTPGTDIDVKTGNTPTLRLQQDGSSGFTAQTWDVAGNETNFFVRDVTNGSKLPLRIKPSAPSNAIYVDSDGDVGLGTTSPGTAVALDITRAGDAIIELSNTSSGVDWQLKNQGDNFRITTPPGGTDEVELEVNTDGDLILSGFLSIRDGVAAPAASANPAQAQIYVDSADGDLKVKFSDGTVRVLASDS
ncbi:hypothetical protein [Thalassovita aquimarina]|nr:hypothetical protein [Thalassovita aquimarina]